MQYPVPQFTDVEDKIIGSLTIKQFGILFGAGILIFLPYSATKNIYVLVFFCVFVGIPAIGIAFAKVNGRPLYRMFPYVYRFMTSPRLYVFHKESRDFSGEENVKNVEVAPVAEKKVSRETTVSRLREVNTLLEKQAAEEKQLSEQLK